MLTQLPRLDCLHPRRNSCPGFTDFKAAHRQGWLVAQQAVCWPGEHAPPLRLWRSAAKVSPHVLPKGAISQPHAHFQLLALGFPTLNSFSFQIYIQVFFSYVIKTHGNKGKMKEWRKTIAESARMKKKNRSNLSNRCWWRERKPPFYQKTP